MVFLYDLTMSQIILRIVAALFYACLQGFLLAAILTLTGDPRPRQQGWLTLNPFRHLLVSGVFLTIAFQASWVQPPPYSPARTWFGRLRPLATILVSFALLLALVPLLDLARAPLHQMLPRTGGYAVLASIDTLQRVIIGAIAIGVLPFPGLLAGWALLAIFPRLAKRWRKLSGIGMAAAAILLVLGWFPDIKPLLAALRLV
ncbi:hypothetical protein DRW48_13725 [Paracoccus suum]|uniref:Uncharacterized protein n=1 Tax=Paracoccus suum TaxID=2259340 RepID=A0A344PMJ8_9RHOB|nr:hypothetical protein [Paracoccus suum]AXC50603.1 hypothetical protein DRW48_13725 [Paracoccus suum]